MCVSDPAISASAELLERGSLLYNLRFLAFKCCGWDGFCPASSKQGVESLTNLELQKIIQMDL